jgi:hypothetical protein
MTREKKDKKKNGRIGRTHDSGSVTSDIVAGGMKPCEPAASVRAAFAAWGSPILPSCGDRLLHKMGDWCPFSGMELGSMFWWL